MTQTEKAPRPEAPERPENVQVPTWERTQPPANPEPDREDMQRSVERMEAVLGR